MKLLVIGLATNDKSGDIVFAKTVEVESSDGVKESYIKRLACFRVEKEIRKEWKDYEVKSIEAFIDYESKLLDCYVG